MSKDEANLASQACAVCSGTSSPVGSSEATRLLSELPDWSIEVIDTVPQLVREFKFVNFAEALTFTDKVGGLAESENHHPAILTEWGKVTVTWWTHSIRGLHKNDFILAAKTDALI